MSPDSCPSPEILNDWAQGLLDDGRAEAVEEHLDICPQCEQRSAKFHLIEPSQLQPVTNDYQAEKECSAAIDRIIGSTGNTDNPSESANRPWDTLTGAKIRDYELIRQLGKGGMGTVYLAEHTQLKKRVAIKVLPYSAKEDLGSIRRFRREMRAVGQLDHPNIVRALDAGEDGGLYFIAMELIIGRDLSDLTKGKRRFSVAAACEIVRQTAEGLQYVHDQGLIHRDIKPSNIMLTQENVRVKILDLGLALLPDSGSLDSVTSDSQLVGTLEYMSPEQTETTEGLNHRIDIYSLGVTLYRLLTGTIPFRGGEYRKPMKRLKALTTIDPPSVATRRNNLPPELIALVDQMIARVPADRPLSMKEVAARLQPFCPDSPFTEIPVSHVDSVELDDIDFSNAKALLNADTSPTACDTAVDRSELDNTAIIPRSQRSKFFVLLAIPIAMLTAAIWLVANEADVRNEVEPPIKLADVPLRDATQPTAGIGDDVSVARPDWQWSEPANLGPPITTEWKDDQPAIAADGLTLFFGSYCIPRGEGEGDRDLWMATRSTTQDSWTSVKNLGSVVNSSMKETHPTYHSPTRTLIFSSNRAGIGEVDLWSTTLSEDGNSWTPPENLGNGINSGFSDDSPEISADGLTLYFSSTRPATTSGRNIWMCTRKSDTDRWRLPKEVKVNSNNDDTGPALTADQLTLVFSSKRDGGLGQYDLWACIRASTDEEWSQPFNLGSPINTNQIENHAAFSPIDDGLFFGSSRTGTLGETDIWWTRRLPNRLPSDQ